MSIKRRLRRRSLLSEIDPSGNIVVFRLRTGGNGKITKCRKKRMPPKHTIVSVIPMKN